MEIYVQITLVIIIILISINFASSSGSSKQLRPGGEKMLIIGIFEHCSPTLEQNQTLTNSMMCQKVIDEANSNKNEFWKFAVERGKYDMENIFDAHDFVYQKYNFCSLAEAIEIAVNIKLNESFLVTNITQSQPKWNKRIVQNWNRSSRIIFVMIYSSRNEISNFFRDVFLGENFVLFFLDESYVLSSFYLNNNVHTASDFLKTNSERLLYHIDSATWDYKENYHPINPLTYFGLIYIEGDSLLYKLEFEYLYKNYLLKFYKDLRKCFFIYKLNMTDEGSLEDLTNKFINGKYVNFIILIGNPKDQVEFLWKMQREEIQSVQWVLYDVHYDYFRSNFQRMSALNLWRIASFDSDTLKFYIDSNNRDLVKSVVDELGMNGQLTAKQLLLAENCKNTFENQMLRIMQLISIYNTVDHFQYITYKRFKHINNRRIKTFGSRSRSLVQFNRIGLFKFGVYFFGEDKYIIKTSFRRFCPIPYCGVGKHLSFGKIPRTSSIWNESYGWWCQKCQGNHYKSKISFDNTTCLPCLRRTLANADQSGCYDPYKKIFLKLKGSFIGIVPILICTLGSLYTIGIMLIFLKSKDTPFVKATDLPISMLHLILILLMFTILPILFIGEPTRLKCTLQPIVVLLLCTCPSTIILMKSQKILLAFKSKTRLSSSQKRKSTAIQYSFTGVIILIDSAVLLLTIITVNPKVIVHFDDAKYEKLITCNTSYHLNMQVAMLILQHLFATVQAYRGRNLPGPFNEAMSIVYSTFIVVMTYSIIFPIYYLQQDVLVKAYIHFVIIPAASGLFIFVFYGSKIFFVVCKTHKNTRTYFRQKMMADSRQKIDYKMKESRCRTK